MSETSQRYKHMADDFRGKLASVAPERWDDPSPCEGWTARDVVRHVVDTHGMFETQVGRDIGVLPSVDDDPLAAFDAARKVVQADLDDPARASVAYEGFFGKTTFEESVGRFLVPDLLIHGWDLARATGLDETMDADEVRRVLDAMSAVPDEVMRSSGVFGPRIEPPEDADEQTRLLAFTGRRS